MDNITHSLVGLALADLTVRRSAVKSDRPLFAGAAVIAANLPDIDVAYANITPGPLGYLLHHRGHTHTVAGLAVLAVALAAAYGLIPRTRLRLGDRMRMWLLIAVALASHVSLDALNSYGVHPFWPFDSTWYYGDAVFIFEPLLWMPLGISAGMNAPRRVARLSATMPVAVLPLVLVWFGISPTEAGVVLAIVGVPFALTLRRARPHVRAAAAALTSVLIICGLVAVSRTARAAAVDALQPQVAGELVDVAMTPNPASPFCWSVIGVDLDKTHDRYVLWHGTLSLAPTLRPPTSCASVRFRGPDAMRLMAGGRFALQSAPSQPLADLRARARTDCRVRAWLQFGRAPAMTTGEIVDLRFGGRGQNFSAIPLDPRDDRCPRFLTNWAMPRADLLAP